MRMPRLLSRLKSAQSLRASDAKLDYCTNVCAGHVMV